MTSILERVYQHKGSDPVKAMGIHHHSSDNHKLMI